MSELSDIAPAFVKMAHEIVWCSAATIDKSQRPRSRVLHPIWEWDDKTLQGWIATVPTPLKRSHINHSPYISLNYWSPNQDTCVAECKVRWYRDDETRQRIWDLFKHAPPPVGYDPAVIPNWHSPGDDDFAVLGLTPWRLRVFPGTVLRGGGGEVLSWSND